MRPSLLALVLLGMAAAGCSESSRSPTVTPNDLVVQTSGKMDITGKHGAKIREALAALLQRENSDAFVIFEEKSSGKFVQLMGSAKEGLVLDLPFELLNTVEQRNAELYFLKLGVRSQEHEMLDQPGGKVIDRRRTFEKDFGRNTDAATQVVLGVFEQVFRFPPEFDLVIKEN